MAFSYCAIKDLISVQMMKKCLMKIFLVHLTDGRTVEVRAETYSIDKGQYVFHGADPSEAGFFKEDSVTGITSPPELSSVNPPYVPPPDDGFRRRF